MTKTRRHYLIASLLGAVIGAFLGLQAYWNNWLG